MPAAIGDFLILRAVRESGGSALAVSDDDILRAQEDIASTEGVLMCPEGAATFVAWQQALQLGLIGENDRSVLFNCATGLKYPMRDSSLAFSSLDAI